MLIWYRGCDRKGAMWGWERVGPLGEAWPWGWTYLLPEASFKEKGRKCGTLWGLTGCEVFTPGSSVPRGIWASCIPSRKLAQNWHETSLQRHWEGSCVDFRWYCWWMSLPTSTLQRGTWSWNGIVFNRDSCVNLTVPKDNVHLPSACFHLFAA